MGITPGAREARFPGFDVVGERSTWDEVTQGVVLARLAPPGPLRFFTADEEPTVRALLDRLLGQDDEPRVPVAEMVDARLLAGQEDGYRYDDMPADADAWRRSVAAIDGDARQGHQRRFHQLGPEAQRDVIEAVRRTDGAWHGLPAARVFGLWMRYACSAFYSHPWAWNEIGFGGPAYPRGYKNIGLDRREPWESAERDATDPIPWVHRVEQARAAHLGDRSPGRSDRAERSQW